MPSSPIAAPATQLDGVETRTEAAHDEVYVRLTRDELGWPAMRATLDELEAWTTGNDRVPAATFR